MSNGRNDLHFEHLKGQAQFAYFQLGLAASAIAFAVHETKDDALNDTPWPIGLAVVLWAASFALGCFGVTARQRGILTNVQLLDATKAAEEYAHDPEFKAIYKEAQNIAKKDVNRPGPRFRWQMYLLFLGGIAYVGGHVTRMAATPSELSKAKSTTQEKAPSSVATPSPSNTLR